MLGAGNSKIRAATILEVEKKAYRHSLRNSTYRRRYCESRGEVAARQNRKWLVASPAKRQVTSWSSHERNRLIQGFLSVFQ